MSAKPGHSAALLEGWDDMRLYGNFMHPKCLAFAVDGRQAVLGTLAILKHRRRGGVIGIIDADTDHMNGIGRDEGVFHTDHRDVECHLIDSLALDRLFVEHLVDAVAPDIRSRLFTACRDIGVLRWLVEKNAWSLDFKRIDYQRFVDPKALTVNRAELCAEIIRVNPGFGLTPSDLGDAISEADDPKHKPIHVCAGHDLTAVLALYVTQKIAQRVSQKDVERHLRLAIDRSVFANSRMFKQILSWEKENIPFVILKDVVRQFREGLPKPASRS